MYYVWTRDLDLDEDFAFFSDEPDGFDPNFWISAEKIVAPPAIELVGDTDSPATLSDLLLTGFQLQVFSPRLVSLLTDMQIQNVQYLPIRIINHETREVETTYRIANIVGAIDCLDLKNCEYARSRGSGNIIRVSKFGIIPEKIMALVGMQGPPLIFRLGEFKRHILVHESVREACQRAGITGLKFTPPETYV
jgi:hypothetical protein